MDARRLAESALTGWRGRVGDRLASRVAPRTALDVDQVRALVGLGFFAVSLWYVVATLVRLARRA